MVIRNVSKHWEIYFDLFFQIKMYWMWLNKRLTQKYVSVLDRVNKTAGNQQSVWIFALTSCLLWSVSLLKTIQGELQWQTTFLSKVKYILSKYILWIIIVVPSSVVYLFSCEPHRDVTYSVHKDSEYTFLPKWYVDGMTSSQDSRH